MTVEVEVSINLVDHRHFQLSQWYAVYDGKRNIY